MADLRQNERERVRARPRFEGEAKATSEVTHCKNTGDLISAENFNYPYQGKVTLQVSQVGSNMRQIYPKATSVVNYVRVCWFFFFGEPRCHLTLSIFPKS